MYSRIFKWSLGLSEKTPVSVYLGTFASASGQNLSWHTKKRRLSMTLALLVWLPIAANAAEPGKLALPSGDLVAPEVVHEEGTVPLIPGQPYTISVKATDNVGVKQVVLFYRVIGTSDYKRILFTSSGDSKYSVTLPGTEVLNPGIEYYVQTEDLAGNTLLTGYSFSPLIVKANTKGSDTKSEGVAALTAGEALAESLNGEGESAAEPIWKNKWLWIGVGAVTAAALAVKKTPDQPGPGAGPSPSVSISACVPQPPATSC